MEHFEDSKERRTYYQWSEYGGAYIPTGQTTQKLPPGLYEAAYSHASGGTQLRRLNLADDGLASLRHSGVHDVIEELERFWTAQASFNQHNVPLKRGVLFVGPPGSGKSCAIKLICQKIFKRGGIAINFTHAEPTIEGLRLYRQIQDSPIALILEDIDNLLSAWPTSQNDLLALLDGVERLNNVVFLATTNHPDRLDGRLLDRPSRFDRVTTVGLPDAETRREYFEHLLASNGTTEINLDRWVVETEAFSLAHLKELFIGVVLLGDQYERVLDRLKNLSDKPPTDRDLANIIKGQPMGFQRSGVA